jgi:uncharacterized protein (UPF0276 family)
MIPVGFTLQPDVEFLELTRPLVDGADYYEVAPETLWRGDERNRLVPNGYHRRFAELRRASGKWFVAHGVGYSLGTASTTDARRRRAWRERVAADRRVFGFRWWTDHLGATSLDGRALTLPVPLPMTAASARVVRRRLAEMQSIVPDVGLENNVAYFTLGDPLEEPRFFAEILRAPRTHLLLDLHNLYTMSQNLGFDAKKYLDAIDLSRVIEVHLSGGKDSQPGWLPDGRTLRLDSHDTAVPEPVWSLLDEALPRLTRLRGVTLERMEGTVTAADVPILVEELRRLRRRVQS